MKNNYTIQTIIFAPFTAIVFLAFFSSAYKFYLLEINARIILNCQWCLVNNAILHEVQFLLTIIVLHLLSYSRYKLLALLFKSLVIVSVLITMIDLVLLKQFLVRFTFHEMIKFRMEFDEVIGFIHQLIANDWKLPVLGGIISITVLIRYLISQRDKVKIGYMSIFALFISIVSLDKIKPIDFHTFYLQNSLAAFFTPQSQNKVYSKGFVNLMQTESTDNNTCYVATGQQPNIIIVMIESLSMYHSQYFSGLQNWMPELDQISKKGKSFPNFYANGVSTEDGLISVLTGLPPIPKGSVKTETIFEQFQNVKQSIPMLLNGLGYHTLFLTTGNLGFLNKGEWLDNIGFQHREGHDAPFYNGMKRIHFDAAPDAALYARAIELIQQEEKTTTPFFITLETVSTHHPHVEPDMGLRSEEKVFNYADKALGDFYSALEKNDFFQNGYLIITSDHRAMMPLRDNEFTRYGDEAFARIPLTMIGRDMKGKEDRAFSQTDILPSLRHWLAKGEQCFDDNQGLFIPKQIQEPDCIYTRRSYSPDKVFVKCKSEKYTIQLDGDQTHFLNKGPSKILEQLHKLRLGNGF
ncbi:MAG: sulfatase-like hydrolase/transferase [Methylococcaceae bacterium]|nr:sulfatase-like hydrolase/transferase [Methylococcaceae bacterium]